MLKNWIRSILRFFARRFVPYLEAEWEHTKHKRLEQSNQALLDEMGSAGWGIVMNGKITVRSPEHLFIGNNVHIGDNAFFSCMGGLFIGDNTHMSRNLTIYTVSHDYYASHVVPYGKGKVCRPVTIARNVWIGMNVSIAPGVSIGEGAVVALGSVVTKDVKPGTVVGGNPASEIKQRDMHAYESALSERRFGARDGALLSQDMLSKYKKHYGFRSNTLFALGGSKHAESVLGKLQSMYDVDINGDLSFLFRELAEMLAVDSDRNLPIFNHLEWALRDCVCCESEKPTVLQIKDYDTSLIQCLLQKADAKVLCIEAKDSFSENHCAAPNACFLSADSSQWDVAKLDAWLKPV